MGLNKMDRNNISQDVLIEIALRTGVDVSDLLFLMRGYKRLQYPLEFEDALKERYNSITENFINK